MAKAAELKGQRFGRLVVVDRAENTSDGKARWLCRCSCGKECVATTDHLRSGHTQSCGCLNADRTSEANKTHGDSGSRLYITWRNMLRRCYYPKDKSFCRYGAKGIKVCEEWHDYEKFKEWATQNGYSDDLTIDRIDNNKGYYPHNCRFASAKSQANNRGTTLKIEYNGLVKSASEWGEIVGISAKTIRKRLSNGWSASDALTKPAKKYTKK